IRAGGTHRGELHLPHLRLAPPTGQAISAAATVWFTFADGRIADMEETHNMPALLRGLGIRRVDEPDPEANKAVIRRVVQEVWTLTAPAAAYDLYAADVRSEGQPLGGPQAVIDNFPRIHAARRDLRYTINELLADGDTVVLWWTGRSTPVGGI